MFKKEIKGSFGYAAYKIKRDLMLTIVMFALSLGLYITGRITTGTNKNLLTIAAVLGLLPAGKMLVSLFMSMKVKTCSGEIFQEIEAAKGNLTGMYHMYFTSYEINYPLIHMVVTDNSIVGFAEPGFKEQEFYNHMKDMMGREGIKDISIKVFTDRAKYINRLRELDKKEASGTNENLINLIGCISL